MELFKNLLLSLLPMRPLAIATPLGAITSSVVVDSFKVDFNNSNHFYSLENGFAARWELQSGIIEAIVSQTALIDEYRAEITDSLAFLWRFKALQSIKQLSFESSWMNGYNWKSGGPDSGQNLAAQTWDDGQNQVSLGTEGDDALFDRAERNDWLPQRYVLQSSDQWTIPLVHYSDKGLIINFGKVFPNECFQAHFVIAWAPYDEESIGTCNAVDLSDVHILEGAAGRTRWQPRTNPQIPL